MQIKKLTLITLLGLLITPITYSQITDIDGNTYKTVKIGEQTWMAKNLKTTTYNDGTPIERKKSKDSWSKIVMKKKAFDDAETFEADSSNLSKFMTGAYCWYNNDSAKYADKYGALYNWFTVKTDKLCPEGWHVPSKKEWTKLEDYLKISGHNGKEGYVLNANSGWPNNNGPNEYGFSALPDGKRGKYGRFDDLGYYAHWWTSTARRQDSLYYDYQGEKAYTIYIVNAHKELNETLKNKASGQSVRCIKD